MPAAVIADKSLAKALWLQGLTATAIGSQLGVKYTTVQQWVSRYRWKREADITRPVAQAAQAVAAKELADRVSSLVAEHSEQLIGVIRDKKAKTLLDCKTAAGALAASYATYRKAMGLDDNAGVQRHMHYHLVDQAVIVERTAIDTVVVDDSSSASTTMALRDVAPAADQPGIAEHSVSLLSSTSVDAAEPGVAGDVAPSTTSDADSASDSTLASNPATTPGA